VNLVVIARVVTQAARLLWEWGAGSGDFESREQELLLDFFKYQNSTKNRNFDGYFFQKNYFW
jgi:hypothetical protein